MVVQPELSEHAHREAGAVVVDLSIPLFAGLRVDVSVVLQFDVLHMQAQQEAIVKFPLVDVRAVLHLTLLCCEAKGKEKYQKRGNASGKAS